MNHRIGRTVFALVVSLLVAVGAYRWASNPAPRQERAAQESVVESSRMILTATIDLATAEIVDPLAPDRKVGKAYVYREDDGWAVSGYYRRDSGDRWHPYLMTLESDLSLRLLKVQDNDPALIERGRQQPLLEVKP